MNYVDPSINYENTAQAWATHLDTPFDPHQLTMCLGLIHAIWRDVSPETIESIEADPQAFAERVSAYRHFLHTEA